MASTESRDGREAEARSSNPRDPTGDGSLKRNPKAAATSRPRTQHTAEQRLATLPPSNKGRIPGLHIIHPQAWLPTSMLCR